MHSKFRRNIQLLKSPLKKDIDSNSIDVEFPIRMHMVLVEKIMKFIHLRLMFISELKVSWHKGCMIQFYYAEHYKSTWQLYVNKKGAIL